MSYSSSLNIQHSLDSYLNKWLLNELAGKSLKCVIMSWTGLPQNFYVEAQTPSTSECGFICRDKTFREITKRVDPNPV